MPLDQLLFINRHQLPFLNNKLSADYRVIHADGLAENRCCNRIMLRARIFEPIQIDGEEVGALSRFQTSDIGSPDYGCSAACAEI